MVVGIIVGVLFEKLFQVTDIMMIIAHNILFNILLLLIFISISVKVQYIYVLFMFLAVGLLYAWNSSVARGLMGKLIPPDRKSTFMGFYSTFTYLGISIVSLLNAILRQLELPAHILVMILFIWAIPAYMFMLILRNSLTKPQLKKDDVIEDQSLSEISEERRRSISIQEK
jgi:MFS-type transporter involved in bile tolerance (Atg22 family)